jgi:hypothetical protein
MNIDNMTIGQAREISALFSKQNQHNNDGFVSEHVGKYCIVRTYASGVFMAKLIRHSGRMAELSEARRLWSWKASEGISLSAVATAGVKSSECRFPAAVPSQTVLDCLEFIPVTLDAKASIDNTPVAKQS